MIRDGKLIIRPYTIRDLMHLYGDVSKKTFLKWLRPFATEIGKREGYYYTITQVQTIVDKLGIPTEIPLDI